MKTCCKCKIVKPFSDFSKCKSRKDGYSPRCKICSKAYYESNKEHYLEKGKKRYKSNKDKHREQTRKWKENNRVKVRQYGKDRYKRKKNEILSKKSYDIIKHKAKAVIMIGKRNGTIIPPSNCPFCNSTNNIEGHHFSYLKKHWSHVIWCCRSCHFRIHNSEYHPKLFSTALEMWINKYIKTND